MGDGLHKVSVLAPVSGKYLASVTINHQPLASSPIEIEAFDATVKCEYCKHLFSSLLIDEHVPACEFRPVICEACGTTMEAWEVETHKLKDCGTAPKAAHESKDYRWRLLGSLTVGEPMLVEISALNSTLELERLRMSTTAPFGGTHTVMLTSSEAELTRLSETTVHVTWLSEIGGEHTLLIELDDEPLPDMPAKFAVLDDHAQTPLATLVTTWLEGEASHARIRRRK